MNILMVTTSYPLSVGSLSGVFVRHLKEAMDSLCSVDVVCPDDCSTYGVEPSVFRSVYALKKWQVLAHGPGGIPVQIKKNNLLILLVPFFLLSLFFSVLTRAKKYDVLHAHWAVSGAICALARYILKKPLITTLRGEDVKKNLNAVNVFFLRMALSYSDLVILVSQDMHQNLISMFPQFRNKYRVINNGVGDMFRNKPTVAARNCFNGSFFQLVSVGSLIPRKNIAFTLNALSVAKRVGLRFEYRIIGEGDCQPVLLELCRELELSDCVCFLGACTPEQVAAELAATTFLISSSKHEGRPNAVVEAMAAGCCVILSDIDGHRELVQTAGCGVMFSLTQEDDLVSCLRHFAAHPELVEEMGRAGRHFVEAQDLAWSACAKRYFECYEEIVNG